MAFDLAGIRAQFPLLTEQVGGEPLAYLDNAATTQKPQAVLDAENGFYLHSNANINRGVHILAERATVAFDEARKTVQQFLGARYAYEIIFTRNATEAINLVAKTWGRQEIGAGDTIVLTVMEHHSNIVPWQQLAAEKRCTIEWLDIDESGSIDMKRLSELLDSNRVKLVTLSALSNVLGVAPPLDQIIEMAHAKGAKVLVDGAQWLAHRTIDVQAMDVDFFACSSHKVYGPTGIGALYGKTELLNGMPPFLGGGDMIQTVTKSGFTPAELPRKFEAGTPAIAQAVGFGAALQWLTSLDRDALEQHEWALLSRAADALRQMKGIRLLSPANVTGCISFTIDKVHPHDLTDVLGSQGICLRAGHHCTQPLHERLGIAASNRLSVAAYNTPEEIDRCVDAIEKAKKLLQR